MYDYNVCVSEANAFLRVAIYLEESVVDFLCGGMYPFAVNAAFACELFLKAILICNSSNGNIAQGHHLESLFSSLPEAARNQIEGRYTQKCNHDFSSLLTEIDNAFVDWRYAYEKGVGINISGILAFANSLKEYVETLN